MPALSSCALGVRVSVKFAFACKYMYELGVLQPQTYKLPLSFATLTLFCSLLCPVCYMPSNHMSNYFRYRCLLYVSDLPFNDSHSCNHISEP